MIYDCLFILLRKIVFEIIFLRYLVVYNISILDNIRIKSIIIITKTRVHSLQ